MAARISTTAQVSWILYPTRLFVFPDTVVDAGGGRPMSNSGWACPELVGRPFRLLQWSLFSGIFCCDRVDYRTPADSVDCVQGRDRGAALWRKYLVAVIPASRYQARDHVIALVRPRLLGTAQVRPDTHDEICHDEL